MENWMAQWTQLPDKDPSPNFDNLLAVLRGEVPERPTLFEFFLNDRLYQKLAPSSGTGTDTSYSEQRRVMNAYHRAGYDHVNVLVPGFSFPSERLQGTRTVSINEGGLISDWQSFDSYQWPDPAAADYAILDVLGKELPEGMKLIPYSPNGVLENVIEIVGYETLCYLIADDQNLAGEVFEAVGSRLVRYFEIVAAHPSVGACIDNDDWGFKTQTMLSHRQLRKFVFPWHKRIVKVIHDAGVPVILHSCGHFERILDDLDDIGIDGRHSYEDSILPVEQAYEKYRDRFAILGGIDVDFICRASPEKVYARSRAMLERSEKRGGYALGTGNSVPDYVPDENFFAMIRAAWDLR
jgi:uroporphyrinogen decarboxylase